MPYALSEDKRTYAKAWYAKNRPRLLVHYKMRRDDPANKAKRRAYTKLYYEKNRARIRLRDKPLFRARALMSKYGLTPRQYDAMLLKQGGVCAICLQPPPAARNLAVDHNRGTGRIRGLLCYRCNRGIMGFFDGDRRRLGAVSRYISSSEVGLIPGSRFVPWRSTD